jgi:hypothetical protein
MKVSLIVDEEKVPMKTWINVFLTLALLSFFIVGCSEWMKETKLKCPKCGAYFTTKEGADEFYRMLYSPRE